MFSAARMGLLAISAFAFLAFAHPSPASEPELRGLWVDTFNPALRNPSQVRQLIADARRGGFNALFVEVRKRGDAYYASRFEPRASDLAPGFDPLALLLQEAHDTSLGPRLSVHAWIVAFNIWNRRDTPPPQLDHPFRLHPDWLTRQRTGETWDGANYAFDPGHPEVQEHTFNVAMDLIRRYPIDGFHWDYVRYAGREWGYHPQAIARFQARHGTTTVPSPDDPRWLQFRRDQITALVRKVHLAILAEQPHVLHSAATITFAPGITSTAQWPSTSAYSDVLQDWRAWMEEGLLDFHLPMVYFRQETHAQAFEQWTRFIQDHQYRRHAALGLGWYLNSASNTLAQLRLTRTPSPAGNRSVGVAGFSYASPPNDLSRDAFYDALVQASPLPSDEGPPFAIPVPPPGAPWKTDPAFAHLRGFVRLSPFGPDADDAQVLVCPPSPHPSFVLHTDGTGHFGAVDLPPGTYHLAIDLPGHQRTTQTTTLTGTQVASTDWFLNPVDPEFPGNIQISAGATQAWISWSTPIPTEGFLHLLNDPCAPPLVLPSVHPPGTRHLVVLTGLEPNQTITAEIVTRTADTEHRSATLRLSAAGSTLVDNPQATFTPGWALISDAIRPIGTSYRRAPTLPATQTPATATWQTPLPLPGLYSLEAWIPAVGERSRLAPYEVHDDTGVQTLTLDQSATAGAWVPLAQTLSFRSNTTARVLLRNTTGESNRLVLADALRWRYLESQDRPQPDQLPTWWALHFFNTTLPDPALASEDTDGDGSTNAEEYLTGTDPLDGRSALSLHILPPADGPWNLRVHPWLPDRLFILESRLPDPGSPWIQETTHWLPDDQGGARTVLTPADNSRWYRIQVGWPVPNNSW
jgi:uncharacterized lipoprotein YddW (UPF0748 family)